MKIGILGAGISGLSISKLLSKHFDVEILERGDIHGGIARTRKVNGIAYHPVGGHCFNSKYPEVLDFVFNEVLDLPNWHKIIRDAVIKFSNSEISYPIEFAVKEIHAVNPDLALEITRDFLNSNDDGVYSNLEEWFRKKFGNRLAESYFIPYNEKIWNRHPSKMSPDWVEGKLPIPDMKSFFSSLLTDQKDKMPHSSFFYPNSNDQNTFIDALARDSKILYNYNVKRITYNTSNKKWLVNDQNEYDILISTLPLNILPSLIEDTPSKIQDLAAQLKYNKVSTMLWKTTGTSRTWTYVPEKDIFFHRYIHIGSFHKPKGNYSITEAVGEKTYEEMVQNGRKDPFLLEPLDYNVSDHAYVVFDENYQHSVNGIKEYLTQLPNIYTLGRFGEWQYYNMDICIKSSLELAKEILFKSNRL